MTHYIVRSPEGRETLVKALSPFCRQYGLTQSAMCRVARGLNAHHKGWECRFPCQSRPEWLKTVCQKKRTIAIVDNKKFCPRCESYLPFSDFSLDSTTKSGLTAYCRECCKKKNNEVYCSNKKERLRKAAAYRRANQQAVRKRGRNFYKANKSLWIDVLNPRRRALKKRNGKAEAINRKSVWERDGKRCYLCSKPIALQQMRLDHCVPLSRGGTHTHDNVAASCARCNTSKRDKTVAEYLAWR